MEERFPKGSTDWHADLLRRWEEEHGTLSEDERAKLVATWSGAVQDQQTEAAMREELARIVQERQEDLKHDLKDDDVLRDKKV